MLDTLTWTCMVCGDERPDVAISVAHRPVRGLEGMFPGSRVNVRYCNDRAECVGFATAPRTLQGPARGRQPDEFPPVVCMKCGTPQLAPPPVEGAEPRPCARCAWPLGFVRVPDAPTFRLVPVCLVAGPDGVADLGRQLMVRVQGRHDLRACRYLTVDELENAPIALRDYLALQWRELQEELRAKLTGGVAPPEPGNSALGNLQSV